MIGSADVDSSDHPIRRISVRLVLIIFLVLSGSFSRLLAETLTCKVIGPDKAPVAGAQVSLATLINGQFKVLHLTTGADGSFTADTVLNGDYAGVCVIQAKGFGIGGGYVQKKASMVFSLTPPGSVSGTVVDASSEPVAGVVVRVAGLRMASGGYVPLADDGIEILTLQATTDAKGRYSFDGLGQGSTAGLELNDPRYALDQTECLVGANATPLITKPGLTLTGEVLYDGGKPAANVDLNAIAQSSRTASFRSATTDATGHYRFSGLTKGSYTVMPMRFSPNSLPTGWLTDGIAGVIVASSGANVAPDITLVREAVISGTVTDAATGKPVPGAAVATRRDTGGGSFRFSQEAAADVQGKFTLHVTPGPLEVLVEQPANGFMPDDNGVQVKAIAGLNPDITLKLQRGITVAGSVSDDSGNPAVDVVIQLTPADQSVPYRPNSVTSDASGAFTVSGLKGGDYTLRVTGPWKLVSLPALTISASSTAAKLVVQHLQLLTLGGKVSDTSGAPVAGVQVNFEVITPVSESMNEGRYDNSVTDDQGKFAISDIRPDERIESPSIAKDSYVVISGGKVSGDVGHYTVSDIVVAQENASASGIVRGPDDKPVPGSWVVCPGGGGPDLPVQADATGHFKLTGLIAGKVDIYAAKGRLFGHRSVDTGDKPVSIGMDPTGGGPAPADRERGYGILKEAAGATGNDRYGLGGLAAEIGAYDPDLALQFMADAHAAPSDNDIAGIIYARAIVDPAAALQWGMPQIAKMKDSVAIEQASADLGFAILPLSTDYAKQCYAIAKANPNAMDQGGDPGNREMEVAALAAALGEPNAQAMMEADVKTFKDQNSNGKGLSKYNGPNVVDSMTGNFPGIMGAGNVDLAQLLVGGLRKENQDWAKVSVIRAAAKTNPKGALAYFESLEEAGGWAYGPAAEYALPILAKSDPQGMQKVISRLKAGGNSSQALAVAADLLPLPGAIDLYRSAESQATGMGGEGDASAGWIAARAWLRDKTLGDELFQEAADSVETSNKQRAQNGGYIPPTATFADLAYCEARMDPGFSRLLIEKSFAADGKSTDWNSPAVNDAVAMAAVEVDRAVQMAYTLPQDGRRLDTVRSIAHYVMLSSDSRLHLEFERLVQNSPWMPGRAGY